MKKPAIVGAISKSLKERSLPYLKENRKIITEFILTLFFIALAIWFINHERSEIQDVKRLLVQSRWQLILAGIGVAVAFIVLQGLLYKAAFASLQCRVPLRITIMLFLKRNVISVFLPAGGVSSLAFFTDDIDSCGVSKTQIHLASSIYAFTGILTVAIVALPTFAFALLEKSVGTGEIWALSGLVLLILILYLAFRSIRNNGMVHRWLVRIMPVSEVFLTDLQSKKIIKKYFLLGMLSSVLIEATGILLLYLAMTPFQLDPSIFAAIMAYITSVIFLAVSPFLRGLGAVEVSMSFILIRFGYSHVEAITITLFYRFFEFWLPLFTGIVGFFTKINKLLLRLVPALLLLTLGIINIISVLTPAIPSRLARIQDFLPVDAINVSNYFVIAAGLFLLVTAAFMLKGLRSTWWIALALSIISFFGHILKGIDYEEASVALIVMFVLLRTYRDYYVKSHSKLRSAGLQTAFLAMLAVLIYGTVGFYYLHKKHFNIDFSLIQAINYTLQNFFLVGSPDLAPADPFARNFLLSIRFSGFLSIAFIVYVLVRPYALKKPRSDEEVVKATKLLQDYGNSSLDYYKIYPDKSIYTPPELNAFIAFRVAGNFAVALENPVAENTDQMEACILSFDKYCYESGQKSIYYRVPEASLPIYRKLKKKSLLIGQEGVIELATFTLEGRDRKTLRHAVNKVTESGYKTTVHAPPVRDGVLQKIKLVSSEWLKDTGRKEITFSQGVFSWEELKQQTIITVENPEEKIVAFLNIIPDYTVGEGTYDLLRKTSEAPSNTSEFLLIRLCEYLKSNGFSRVNLGFAPMSGMDDPQNFPEKSMRFAYERLRSFSHYKGLRDFKERFYPLWYNKYLVYEHDYDLLQAPQALARVIRP